jgi:hypothetical protein
MKPLLNTTLLFFLLVIGCEANLSAPAKSRKFYTADAPTAGFGWGDNAIGR